MRSTTRLALSWRSSLVTSLSVIFFTCFFDVPEIAAADEPLKVLFLGGADGSHRPRARFNEFEAVMRERGVALTYTDEMSDINAENLANYGALVVYANIDRIEPDQEKALLNYVAGGGGFVPLHCASFCFRNSPEVVALIGAQFQRHGWESVKDTLAEVDHPINRGYGGFESMDESYVHRRHNDKDRVVIAYRVDDEGREPWTWIRTHGQGRVFYTAWGHDQRTWSNPGFHNLVERGIRWAAGRDPADAGQFPDQAAETGATNDTSFVPPKMSPLPEGPPPFEYVDVGAEIPNYQPGQFRSGQGEPLRMMQKPLSPAESMKRISVPEGFHAELFAAEPDIGGKPICMTWDERGRLWLAETVDYPNELKKPEEGRDRIRICEDTNGDGRADKFTIFAEQLSIPTSIAFAHGGVLVHSATQTLFLKDTNGDDRADERRELLETWALPDTHGGPSNMQYGLDNWIWGMQGYNTSTIRTGENRTRFAQGFHRFRSDGSAIEFIRSTSNNTWGFGMSEEGLIFGSTANRHPSIYMPIANRYYERVRGWAPELTLYSIADTHLFQAITDKVRQVDHHGGYTAAAGHAVYTARRYPRQYWNQTAFVCEPTGHLVGTFVLERDSADFRSTNPANLFASDDEWVAPIMAEVGPDGNVWVIDWYNFIVQHNPTPRGFETGDGNAYETKLRDKQHGRIYRIVYDAAPPAKPLDLSRATPAELVATLANDNLFWRRHAQRLLVERGQADVVPRLIELVKNSEVDPIGLNVGAIHALWTLHGLGALDDNDTNRETIACVYEALRHPAAGVRRNALQVLPPCDEATDAILTAELLNDADAQVRLAALLALSDQPASAAAGRAVAIFLSRSENFGDRWLVDAATSAAASHAGEFLLACAKLDGAPSNLREVSQIVANHFARSEPGDAVRQLIASLATADPAWAGAVVAGLKAGWPEGRPLPQGGDSADVLRRLRERLSFEDQIHLVGLEVRSGSPAAQAQVERLTGSLFAQLEDPARATPQRIQAANMIVALNPTSPQVAGRLLDLATPQTTSQVSAAVIKALADSRMRELGTLVIDRLNTFTPATREAVFELLLSRPSRTDSLLNALEEGKIVISELSLAQRRRLIEYPDRPVRIRANELLDKGGQTINADRQQVLDEYASIAGIAGSPGAGKAVFTKHCANCHTIRGEGAAVGPDLTGMSVLGKEELLVHILDPSRDVEGNYHSYSVVLADGRVLSGMLAGESATSIELIDAEANRRQILREEIDELTRSGKSVMPEGFEKLVSREELADLLEFLTERTQFVPLDLGRIATTSNTDEIYQAADPPVAASADSPSAPTTGEAVENAWGLKPFSGVPFYRINPHDGRVRNVVMLRFGRRDSPSELPRSVELPCRMAAKAIHFLAAATDVDNRERQFGGRRGGAAMLVRLHYADGEPEDHPITRSMLLGDRAADAGQNESEPDSTAAQMPLRYFKIEPKSGGVIRAVELAAGFGGTSPAIIAVTAEQL
jgi:putative membrane-bound dehydrogenase-like protein